MSTNSNLLGIPESIEYDRMVLNLCNGIIDANIDSIRNKILTEEILPDVSIAVRYYAIKALEIVRVKLYRIIKHDHRAAVPTVVGSRVLLRVGITSSHEISVNVARKEFSEMQPWQAVDYLISNLQIM